jgi:glycine hydroxymethyltransferase
MVDMAHIAGLIAAGYHQSPMPYADIVTSTTHKTLRGPRGGLILTNSDELYKKINFATFPGHQGGPLENIIAGKAQCFIEALTPEYKEYIKGVVDNTRACAERFQELGAFVSGTQTHLFLVDTKRSYGLTGYDAQHHLEDALITLNKNMLPGDTEKPSKTSGVRIGFAALTTRGCDTETARAVADIIHAVLSGRISAEVAKRRVRRISSKLKDVTTL